MLSSLLERLVTSPTLTAQSCRILLMESFTTTMTKAHPHWQLSLMAARTSPSSFQTTWMSASWSGSPSGAASSMLSLEMSSSLLIFRLTMSLLSLVPALMMAWMRRIPTARPKLRLRLNLDTITLTALDSWSSAWSQPSWQPLLLWLISSARNISKNFCTFAIILQLGIQINFIV